MRKNIVVGNWKMNLKREVALDLVSEILSQLPECKNTEIVFAPCFLYLYKIAKMCNNFEIHYESPREGLAPLAIGTLKGIAQHFGGTADITQIEYKGTDDHDVFEVKFTDGS